MINFKYYVAKLLKKIRGSAITNSKIHKTAKIESGCNIVKSSMGRYSFCGYDCDFIWCDIGSFCCIANDVKIGGAKHPVNWVAMSSVFYKGKDSISTKFAEHSFSPMLRSTIGHDVWIGQSVLIKQGVKIGNGAVIGMGSIVTKDVPPYTIVAGNPAKVIKIRFNEEVVLKLLETKWWTLPEERLLELGPYVNNVDNFLINFTK